MPTLAASPLNVKRFLFRDEGESSDHRNVHPSCVLVVLGTPTSSLAISNRCRRGRRRPQAEIKSRFSSNVVLSRKFSDMLADVLRRYQNRSIETAQVIEELVAMSKKLIEDGDLAKN
jgi:hypothetical protein